MSYALGKTPLSVRMDRYLDEFCPFMGITPTYIPIHPTELAKLNDKASFSGVYRSLQMLPLGSRTPYGPA